MVVEREQEDVVSLCIVLAEHGIARPECIVTDIINSRKLCISRAGSTGAPPILELEFPCTIVDDTCKAKYKTKTGMLMVSAQPAVVPLPASNQAATEDVQQAAVQRQTLPADQRQSQAEQLACSTLADDVLLASGEAEGRNDAELLREFADEAYQVSLGLHEPSTSRQQPKDSEHFGMHAAAFASKQPTGKQADTRLPGTSQPLPASSSPQSSFGALPSTHLLRSSQPSTLDPVTASLAQPTAPASKAVANTATPDQSAHSSGAPPAAPQNPEVVQLASSIDCSHLTAAFCCSFGLGFGSRPASGGKQSKKDQRRKATATLKAVAEQLQSKGWAACDGYIPADVVSAVRHEIKQMESHYTPGEIWVGKEADAGTQVTVSDVRGDSVLWMDDQALSATAYVKDGKKQACSFYTLQQVVKAVDQLVVHELARHVPDLLSLAAGGRSDAMLAIYPPASRFAKHIDNSANDGRRLTCLCYLNNGWQEQMGGALRLTSPGHDPVDVLPLGGRVAFFWSKTVAHEVRRTHQPRHSFTLWYYDALEKAEALASARVGGQGSAAAQAQARALLRDILAQDVITPTEEGCRALALRIKAMTTSALQIVSGIVGASNVSDFVFAASNMTPDRLGHLRDEIGRMGLHNHAPTVLIHANCTWHPLHGTD